MDVEIHGVNTSITSEQLQRSRQQEAQAQKRAQVARRRAQEAQASNSRAATQQYVDEILDFADIFNRRLKFSVSEGLNRIVVKVIDAETDKVIKEIPPEALQRLHIRMREAIGLLIDESI